MNKILIILFSLVASVSFAQKKGEGKKAFSREYGLAGCGLGSVLVGKRSAQIFASTTNGSTSNQMFGITSGTLNCLDSASSEVASRMDQFIIVNRSQLQGDVARGNGETIAALESFMGCESASVGQTLKSNYSEIFNDKAVANEVTDNVISVILSTPELSKNCKNLG